jgi:hypothetical protein
VSAMINDLNEMNVAAAILPQKKCFKNPKKTLRTLKYSF